MKLLLAIAVVFLSGWSLALPQKLRPSARTQQYGIHQMMLRNAALAARASQPATQPVDSFNFIDLQLLQRALETEKGNLVLSPASVKTTLSMLFEGADGHTAEEIGQALRLDRLSRDKQEEVLHQFQHNLTVRGPGISNSAVPSAGSTLEVASQVFYGDGVHLKQAYADTLRKYNADTHKVNMSDPQLAANAINTWVNRATRGHIPTLVQQESLSESALMVLANAVYFQGAWQTAFDPLATQPDCFYTEANECIKVPMMETTGAFRSKLIRELDSTLLELPYDDGRFSMLLLLPELRDGMQRLVRDLPCCGNLLHVLNNDLEDSEYVVSIPRFAIEFDTDLVPILNKLQINDVFSPAANLSRMVKHDNANKMVPGVSNVFHKAKIMVDERGAIAAGASGALVVPLMGGPQPRFRADHPFLFFIRDARTGGFLFAGRVSQPRSDDVELGNNAAYAPEKEAAPQPPAAQHALYAQHTPHTLHAALPGQQQFAAPMTSKRATPVYIGADINFPNPSNSGSRQ